MRSEQQEVLDEMREVWETDTSRMLSRFLTGVLDGS